MVHPDKVGASPPALETRPTAQPITGDAGVSPAVEMPVVEMPVVEMPAVEMPAVEMPGAQPNSPASPTGGAVGSVIPTCREPHHTQAGWYTRLQAAKGDKGGMRCNSPASLAEGGEGVRGREVDTALNRIRSKGGSQPNSPALNSTPAIKFAKYLIPAAVIILLLICSPPASLLLPSPATPSTAPETAPTTPPSTA